MKSESTLKANDFILPLASAGVFQLSKVLNKGAVILNFISGTWCPLCQKHLSNMQRWQEKLSQTRKNITILVISCQQLDTIRDWLKENPVPFLFASDPEGEVARSFGINTALVGTVQPATFLIDVDKSVRLSYVGIGGDALHRSIEAAEQT